MGLKDKMMDGMMGKMSADEKKEMMDGMMNSFFSGMSPEEKSTMMNSMMEKFFSSMSPEEKKNMMQNMMPKMMKSMMGGGSMPEMMKRMMKGMKHGEGFNPMDMCQKMMSSVGKSSEMAAYATPELRGLFEEWLAQMEDEILQFIRENGTADAQKTAEHFKLSKESAAYCLSRLAQKGRITIKAETAD